MYVFFSLFLGITSKIGEAKLCKMPYHDIHLSKSQYKQVSPPRSMARAALVTLLAVAVVAVAALASTAQAQQAQQSGTAVQEVSGRRAHLVALLFRNDWVNYVIT